MVYPPHIGRQIAKFAASMAGPDHASRFVDLMAFPDHPLQPLVIVDFTREMSAIAVKFNGTPLVFPFFRPGDRVQRRLTNARLTDMDLRLLVQNGTIPDADAATYEMPSLTEVYQHAREVAAGLGAMESCA